MGVWGDGSFGGRYDAVALKRIWRNLSSCTFEYVMRTKRGAVGRRAEWRSRNKEQPLVVIGDDD